MDYFDVIIANSAAVFEEISETGGLPRFLDADGNEVQAPEESPIRYEYRCWCSNRPAWMEQLPAE